MPTDEERRRVAAALREYASFDCEDEDEEECLVDCADWGERVLNLLSCGDTEGECYARLADLIDPSKSGHESGQNPDSVPKEFPAVQKAPECDRDALLELADEMDSAGEDGLLVCDSDLMSWTYRIRKALGVES